MTEVVLHQSPSHFPSTTSSSSSSGSDPNALINSPIVEDREESHLGSSDQEEEEEEERCGFSERERKERDRDQGDQLSVLELLVAAFRKSLIGPCSNTEERGKFSSSSSSMDIGWPSNVRHVAHVTFDRFNGFLGLPVEFEPEVPRRPPSARSVPTSIYIYVSVCI